jgi:ABC-type antimicrobial peptide transport system permease subunit
MMIDDIHEEFLEIAREKGLTKAKLWYWRHTILSIPAYLKNLLAWSYVMIKNYFKITIRVFFKHKGFSAINTFGLSIGMACAILILLWVQDELSFDGFHENKDKIYRLVHESENLKSTSTPIPLSPYLPIQFPEIEYSTRYSNGIMKYSIKHGAKTLIENIGVVEPSFFKMFSFPLLKGSYETAFQHPYSLVISGQMAKKYFGSDEAIGKTLQILAFDKKNWLDFKVTAVMKDIPHNSHLQASCFLPFKAINKLIWWYPLDEWDEWSCNTYLQLSKDASRLETENNINEYFKKRNSANEKSTFRFKLQPLSRIHLYSDYKGDSALRGDIRYVYIFTIIAFLILLIACINFMNLSTARATLRSREVCLRKTVGATKGHLVKQFLGESLLYSMFSLILALILVGLASPVFNQLTGKQLSLHYTYVGTILSLLGIAVITSILAGSYPAFFLSSFRPIQVLQGAKDSISRRGTFRKVLVVIQFSLSVIIIIGTVVLFNQLRFLKNKDIGFNKQNVICMPLNGALGKKYAVLENEILQNPNVLGVTASSGLITSIRRGFTGMSLDGERIGENIRINYFQVNHNFLDLFKMKILKGRSFSEDLSTDKDNSIIINQTLAKLLEKESLVGKKARIPTMPGYTPQIIGIVDDFHFKSLHSQVKPLILSFRTHQLGYMYVKFRANGLKSMASYLENIFKKHGLESSFEYHFLDQTINNLYFREQRMARIFRYFAYLAILISCLGLFGLVSFIAEKRTKEIGIRKVFGSSVTQITVLLSREFIKWVLIANIIAWPIAWYVMNQWLKNFAYRTNVGVWVLLLAGALSIMIALLTVSYQAIRAATANPVEALRYE